MKETMKELADRINRHLRDGGAVQVTTYLRSTIYYQQHAGWFSEQGGELLVQRGRGKDRLSIAGKVSVGIRFGRKNAADVS